MLVASHGRGELYDLEADPMETRNLWDDPGYRGVKLEMYERLVDRMGGRLIRCRNGGWSGRDGVVGGGQPGGA